MRYYSPAPVFALLSILAFAFALVPLPMPQTIIHTFIWATLGVSGLCLLRVKIVVLSVNFFLLVSATILSLVPSHAAYAPFFFLAFAVTTLVFTLFLALKRFMSPALVGIDKHPNGSSTDYLNRRSIICLLLAQSCFLLSVVFALVQRFTPLTTTPLGAALISSHLSQSDILRLLDAIFSLLAMVFVILAYWYNRGDSVPDDSQFHPSSRLKFRIPSFCSLKSTTSSTTSLRNKLPAYTRPPSSSSSFFSPRPQRPPLPLAASRDTWRPTGSTMTTDSVSDDVSCEIEQLARVEYQEKTFVESPLFDYRATIPSRTPPVTPPRPAAIAHPHRNGKPQRSVSNDAVRISPSPARWPTLVRVHDSPRAKVDEEVKESPGKWWIKRSPDDSGTAGLPRDKEEVDFTDLRDPFAPSSQLQTLSARRALPPTVRAQSMPPPMMASDRGIHPTGDVRRQRSVNVVCYAESSSSGGASEKGSEVSSGSCSRHHHHHHRNHRHYRHQQQQPFAPFVLPSDVPPPPLPIGRPETSNANTWGMLPPPQASVYASSLFDTSSYTQTQLRPPPPSRARVVSSPASTMQQRSIHFELPPSHPPSRTPTSVSTRSRPRRPYTPSPIHDSMDGTSERHALRRSRTALPSSPRDQYFERRRAAAAANDSTTELMGRTTREDALLAHRLLVKLSSPVVGRSGVV